MGITLIVLFIRRKGDAMAFISICATYTVLPLYTATLTNGYPYYATTILENTICCFCKILDFMHI